VVREDDAQHDDVLKRVMSCLTSEFKIAHATVQVEGRECAASEAHL